MRNVSRRSAVLTGVVGLTTFFAGCSGESDSSDGGSNEPSREQIISSREEIAEDEYQYFPFDINRQANFEYQFTVRVGPELDVFVLDDQEFDELQGGNRFRTYSNDYGAGGGDALTLSEDSYRLVIDNTNAGEVEPPTNFDDDIAEVEVEAWVE